MHHCSLEQYLFLIFFIISLLSLSVFLNALCVLNNIFSLIFWFRLVSTEQTSATDGTKVHHQNNNVKIIMIYDCTILNALEGFFLASPEAQGVTVTSNLINFNQ